MAFLLILACGWLCFRTLLLLAQASRHTPEAQLARAFQEELQVRDLVVHPAEVSEANP